MGKLGGITVADGTSQYQSGVALHLNQKASEDEIIQIDSDWEVELEAGNPYAVSRGTLNLSSETVLGPAQEAIQKALDILSIQGDADYYCKDIDSERIIWWRNGADQHIRVISISGLGVSTSATVTALDSEGNEITQQQPPTQRHESERYFRLAQITEDLFDAYRNMYLSFEMILSDRTPPNPGERETDWLKRALTDAHNQIGIGKFAPNQSNVVDSIHQQQYLDTRVEIFHAKQNRSRLMPHDADDRKQVQEALENLAPLVTTLMKNTIQINRHTGVITYSGFDHIMSWMESDQNIGAVLSENNIPLDKSESLESPPWQNRVSIPTVYSSNLSESGLKSALGQEAVSNFDSGFKIRRLGLVKKADMEDLLMSAGRLEADLTLDHIDQFETQLGIILRNLQTARTRFPS